jgi:hypothetical protein
LTGFRVPIELSSDVSPEKISSFKNKIIIIKIF